MIKSCKNCKYSADIAVNFFYGDLHCKKTETITVDPVKGALYSYKLCSTQRENNPECGLFKPKLWCKIKSLLSITEGDNDVTNS